MSDKLARRRRAVRRQADDRMSGKENMKRRVSFRITSEQSEELDRLIKRGMNPSSTFRVLFDKMLFTPGGKRRRI